MKLVETYIVQEDLSGMKIIRYQAFGDFTNQVEYLMDLIGIIGGQKKKLLGKKILDFG